MKSACQIPIKLPDYFCPGNTTGCSGCGLLAGLAIAGMAIVFDRYIRAASEIAAYYMGVPLSRKVI